MRQTRTKSMNFKNSQLRLLESGLVNNGLAMADTSIKKKKWSIHDLRSITPITTPQRDMLNSYFNGNNIIANGSAGTGKSFMALYLALTDALSPSQPQDRVVIVRSIVPVREIGHLPGTMEEKIEPYEAPYKDLLYHLTGAASAYNRMKENGVIEFIPTSFIRGINIDNAVVIVDEIQNMNFAELNSIVTRIGEDTRLIMVGDQIQTDLYKSFNDKSGMGLFLKIARKMSSFDEIIFHQQDIVRSNFVKEWICAMEDCNIDYTQT
jgi:phosphate starvation-inducible protein PhoH